MSVASAAVLLFLVMDPLGNVPFFLSALKDVDPARQRRVVARELAVALAVLVFFLFAGRFGRWPEWLLALLLAWPACSEIVFFASGLRHRIGQRGLIAVERLMGMVLVTISVPMLMTGIGQFIASLAGQG